MNSSITTSVAARTALLAAMALAASSSGCALGEASTAPPPAPAHAAARTTAAPAASRIDRLTAIARSRYSEEVHGIAVHAQLRWVARDRALLRALRSGSAAGLQVLVKRVQLTRHRHLTRVRLLRGSRVLADAGGAFVVAPSTRTLRDARGRVLAKLQVSIQDVIGYVRYMHRNHPVDVVVRGTRAGHVESSLPAARRAKLPDRGTATVAGRRYVVRSFREVALGGEPIQVWILARG